MKRKNREVEGWSQPFGLLLAYASREEIRLQKM
jgi:hypothetical protein